MSKKKIAAIICTAIGIIGLFGMFTEQRDDSLLLGSIMLLVIGDALFIWDHFSPAKEQKTSAKLSHPARASAADETTYNSLPFIHDGLVVRYLYSFNLAAPDPKSAAGHCGELAVIREGQVFLNDARIGSIGNEKWETMICDYEKRGDPVSILIRSVSASAVGVQLGFYKPAASLRSKVFKLSGGSKYEDARSTCSVGDEITVSEDIDSGRLIVEASGEEIGTLPASLAESLNINNLVVGEIVSIDDDGCSVKIYL